MSNWVDNQKAWIGDDKSSYIGTDGYACNNFHAKYQCSSNLKYKICIISLMKMTHFEINVEYECFSEEFLLKY